MSRQNKKTEKHAPSLESTMKSLETLLEKLENGETSLDESLQAFEEGISLIRDAQATLARAEQRVQLLLEKDGEPATRDLDSDGEPE